MTIQLIFEFILVLGAVIFLHEFGHFLGFKLSGIQVEEFGFGYPPRLLKMFTLGGTQFTLNWLPFGGFVKVRGETDPDVPGGMAAAAPWKRILAILAGPLMNLLTALVLFIAIYGLIGYLPDRNRVQLVDIAANSPAAQAGLKSGDILVSVGGVEIHALDSVRTVIYSNLGVPLKFVYQRDGVDHEVSITPLANPGDSGAVGIYMSYPMKAYTFWQAIPESFTSMYEYIKELFSMLGKIVRGQGTSGEGRLVGIKGMFDLYSQVRESAGTPGVPKIVNVFLFVASISISAGLLNLLPVPALDGARILFALPEMIIHRRIPPKYEMWVNFVSFILLILLMLYINLQDFIHPITKTLP